MGREGPGSKGRKAGSVKSMNVWKGRKKGRKRGMAERKEGRVIARVRRKEDR